MSPHGVSVNLSELPAPRSDHSRMAFLSEYPDDEQALVRIVSPYEGLEVSLRWNARTFPYASYWMEAGIARVISGGASFGVTVLLRSTLVVQVQRLAGPGQRMASPQAARCRG